MSAIANSRHRSERSRIERSEIGGLPFGTGLPYLDFAALNPGYNLTRAISLFGPQCEFAQIAPSLPQGVEPFTGCRRDGGDRAAFLLGGGGLVQAVTQAMPDETQGVGDVDHLIERVLHVEAKLDQLVLRRARAQGRTGTRFSRGHGKTPANPAM
jgi:hypothetical protein